MRILLVQPASNIMKSRKEAKPALQPLGLGYIAGTLIANGYKDVEILDVLTEGYYNETPFKKDYIRYGLSPKEIKKRIKEFNPDIVGVTCMCDLRKYHALEICELTKEVNPNITTVIGGNPVTVKPMWYVNNSYVDRVVCGEGESEFLRLVKEVERGERRTRIFRQNTLLLHPNLDKYPFPAHHLFALDKHLEIWQKEGYHYYPAKKFTSMVMARGCPNNCEHCPHDVLFPGYRTRSTKNIFEEVKYVHDELGVEEVQFHEYNGIVVWKIVEEFCNLMIESGYNKKVQWGWPIGIWVKVLNREKLTLMREAGMFYVDLAIESIDPRLHEKLMKGKDVDIKHTTGVIRWCNELGYYINCFFMIGLEGQTKDDIELTIQYARTLNVDSVTFFIAQPLPGTPFWDHCVDKKLFIDNFDTFHLRYGKANIKIEGITPEELEAYRHKARQSFNDYGKERGRTQYKGPRGSNFLMKRGC